MLLRGRGRRQGLRASPAVLSKPVTHGRLGGTPFVPGDALATGEDAALVPLSGAQHGVAGAGGADREGDRLGAVGEEEEGLAVAGAGGPGPGGDVGEDAQAILVARIL